MNWIDGTAPAAAFPLGGIGTGNVSIGARGQLRDWELENHPDKGRTLPYTFFAIHCGGVTRVLESRLTGPHDLDEGYPSSRVAGLPRLRSSRLRGEYPLVTVEFFDDQLPVRVALQAFTPFVPLDADASGLPVAVLRYRVSNPGPKPVRVTIVGSLSNPIGQLAGHWAGFAGNPSVAWRDSDGVRGLDFGTSLAPTDLRYGSVALATVDTSVTAKPRWLTDFWPDGVQAFWDDFRTDGLLSAEPRLTLDEYHSTIVDPQRRPVTAADLENRCVVGSLGIVHELAPGGGQDFEFLLSWCFPNRPRGWNGHVFPASTHSTETTRNYYATRYPDAWSAAAYLARELSGLEAKTRAFHGALFGSSLDPSIVDAVSATLATLRSTTCFRISDGTFAAWEGSFEHAGSCEGTCTHVWNYAQSVAWLFPELERSARRIEFGLETDDRGVMQFRTNRLFGGPSWGAQPAADGQLGTIVRLYREWRFSGDDGFLRELWPAAVRALEHAIREWDTDGDGVLDAELHNTYDIEFTGQTPLANTMFYAALRAGAALADRLDDADRADRYRELARLGALRMDALLFNGEYYQQHTDDVDAQRYQFGTGVLSDQLLGQTLAHLVGLGHLLPADHVRAAVAAVHRYNFRERLTGHESTQRTFALDDEGGLLLCSWPRGGRPWIPFIYSDEVWTGVEYQVATHLIYEGLVDEALRIVRATRARHDGIRRNPWNEVECGNHYARSMASWGLLVASSGASYDAATAALGFAPAGPLRTFFSTGTGWGTVDIDHSGLSLALHHGTLRLHSLTLHGRELTGPAGLTLHAGDTTQLPLGTEEPR
jgi:non-lysosomal glucosylceramidase